MRGGGCAPRAVARLTFGGPGGGAPRCEPRGSEGYTGAVFEMCKMRLDSALVAVCRDNGM